MDSQASTRVVRRPNPLSLELLARLAVLLRQGRHIVLPLAHVMAKRASETTYRTADSTFFGQPEGNGMFESM